MDSYLFPFSSHLNVPFWKFFNCALLVALISPLAVFSLSVCYSPNGDIVAGDVPCFPSADVSPCCGAGWDCWGNGALCVQPKENSQVVNGHRRGSCTDVTWQSSLCPQVCAGTWVHYPESLLNAISLHSHDRPTQEWSFVQWRRTNTIR